MNVSRETLVSFPDALVSRKTERAVKAQVDRLLRFMAIHEIAESISLVRKLKRLVEE